MTPVEIMEQEAFEQGVNVDYIDFKSDRLCGLYVDGSIALKRDMTMTRTADVLAEELGHHFTTSGNILDTAITENRKQERTARLWAYNKRIGLPGLIRAYEHHCQNRYEVAEYLGVSEETLVDAMECYRQIYGTGVWIGDYFLRFEPNFTIGKMIAVE